MSDPVVHTIHTQTDLPVIRQTLEMFSELQEAQMRGAEIMRRHRKLKTLERVAQQTGSVSKKTGQLIPSSSSTPGLLLFSMAMYAGVIADGSEGLMVFGTSDKRAIDLIAEAVNVNPNTAIDYMRQLDAAGVIRSISRGGNKAYIYELPMPLTSDEEMVEYANRMSVWQRGAVSGLARASGRPDSELGVKPLQQANLPSGLARASGRPDTLDPCESDSAAENRGVSGRPDTRTTSLNNDINDINITTGEGEENRERLEVVAELHAIGLPPYRITQFAKSVSLREAVAVRIHLSKIKNPDFNRVGLAVKKLSNPAEEISQKDLEAADRELSPATPQAAAPSAASIQINQEREFERKVDQVISSLSEAQLRDVQNQAMLLARTDAGKKAILDADPAKHPLVRSIVRDFLRKPQPAQRPAEAGAQ